MVVRFFRAIRIIRVFDITTDIRAIRIVRVNHAGPFISRVLAHTTHSFKLSNFFSFLKYVRSLESMSGLILALKMPGAEGPFARNAILKSL